MVLWLIAGSSGWAQTTNRIAAVVNDDIITEAEVASGANALQEEGAAAKGASADQMRAAVLQHLIEQRLILQEAQRTATVISAEEVQEHLDALQSRFESQEAFEQSLARSNLTVEQLKGKLRDQWLVQKVIDAKVRSTIVVSPQEVAQAVGDHPDLSKPGDRVRALHLLIRVNEERSEENARERIAEISKQLAGGADFSALAKRYSEDPHADEGGAMGWVAQGELMPELDAALFSLKAGEISPPIHTRLGVHLVKVEERRPAASLSMTEANRTVYQQLYKQKFQDAMARWLSELKRKAYIEIPASS